MKKGLIKRIALALFIGFTAWTPPASEPVFAGLQPQLSIDTQGTVRLVFGRSDSIFCTTSDNGGNSFSKPVFVGSVQGMHLGNTRGPQVASSARYSVVTAIDTTGAIHFFRLNHARGQWNYSGIVNDKKGSAPEGLMSLAADTQDRFYAVWLDVRNAQKNNICFSALGSDKKVWTKNKLVYVSPAGHVCECCKPALAVNGSTIAIQFRNWRSGSRDLYLLFSSNQGRTFTTRKLGTGTWKLNACPMDGGGIALDRTKKPHTVWRRADTIYYCQPGAPEVALATGRSCSIAVRADGKQAVSLLQQDGMVKIVNVHSKKERIAGRGNFAKCLMLPNGNLLCAWEDHKTIHLKQLPF
jgi:hypothetical protein